MNLLYQFFNANGYVFEIMLCVFFFAWWLEKRARFLWRAAAVCAGLLCVSAVTGFFPFGDVFNRSAQTIAIFILCILGTKLCYKIAAGQAAFYVTAAGAAQHFSYKAARMVLMPIWSLGETKDYVALTLNILYPVLFVLFAFGCHIFFGKRLKKEDVNHLTNSPMVLFLLIGMQLGTNIFQNMFDACDSSLEAYTVFNCFDILCCLFLMALQCEIAKKENEQKNNEIMKQILHQQKQQMKISKENIELINIKCHDIKNQIAMLGSRVPQDEIRELEQAVNIYDTALKTGNEALDVLLMEKMMLCENKNIRLDCMVQGGSLSFMRQSDIYSLFGNAIDNAIEAVDKLKDADKRCISVKGRKDKGMLVIHFENFYEGELAFDSGLPRTTKADKRYHGFGMKSIRMITEKYHGYFSVKANQGVFMLNILLEIPKKHTF